MSYPPKKETIEERVIGRSPYFAEVALNDNSDLDFYTVTELTILWKARTLTPMSRREGDLSAAKDLLVSRAKEELFGHLRRDLLEVGAALHERDIKKADAIIGEILRKIK